MGEEPVGEDSLFVALGARPLASENRCPRRSWLLGSLDHALLALGKIFYSDAHRSYCHFDRCESKMPCNLRQRRNSRRSSARVRSMTPTCQLAHNRTALQIKRITAKAPQAWSKRVSVIVLIRTLSQPFLDSVDSGKFL